MGDVLAVVPTRAHCAGNSAGISEDTKRKLDPVAFQKEGKKTELSTLLSERKAPRRTYSQILNI